MVVRGVDVAYGGGRVELAVAGWRGPDNAESAAAARHASGVGWVQAHVRIGRSYPMLAVRVCRRDPSTGAALAVLNSSDQRVVETAEFATVLARRLDELGVGLQVLEVDGSLAADEEAGLGLRIAAFGDVPDGVESDAVRDVALEVLADGREAKRWALSDAAEVSVELPQRDHGNVTAVQEPEAHASIVEVPQVAEEPEPAVQEQLVVASEAEDAEAPPHIAGVEPRRVRGWGLALAGVLVVAAVVGFGLLREGGAPQVAPAPTVEVPTETAAPLAVVATAIAPTAQAPTATPVPVAAIATPVVLAKPTLPPPTVATPAPLLDFGPGSTGLAWPNDTQGVAWFAADGYHLAARRPNQFVAIGVLADQTLHDVLVSATFRKVGGPDGGGYGIIVRDQGPEPLDGLDQGGSYLVFEAGDKGEVGIWRRDQSAPDGWAEILGWTPSPAVVTGKGENVLEVRVQGDQLAFSVNGVSIPTQTSAVPGGGSVGVFLGGDANEAVLSRLRVTRLE